MGIRLHCPTWLAHISFDQQGYYSQRKTQVEIKWESTKVQFSASYNQTHMTQDYTHFKVGSVLNKKFEMTKALKYLIKLCFLFSFR